MQPAEQQQQPSLPFSSWRTHSCAATGLAGAQRHAACPQDYLRVCRGFVQPCSVYSCRDPH